MGNGLAEGLLCIDANLLLWGRWDHWRAQMMIDFYLVTHELESPKTMRVGEKGESA